MKEVLRPGDPVRQTYAIELLVAQQRFENAALERTILVPGDCVELALNALKAPDT
jgi:hypothetical protein